jgi:REP element-mobilizing transposase RayT
MIVKVLSRHSPSYGGLIEYITKEGKGNKGNPVIITHNLKGNSKPEWIKQFIENESFRQHPRKNQIFLYHEIISLSSKENKELITQVVLEDLANQYINFRGKDGMYVAAFHEDKDHMHIHFAISGVKYRTGQAHRLTHQSLHELKVHFQDYHKGQYPFLSNSIPEHGKDKEYLKNKEYFLKTKRTNVKETIKEKIHELFKEAKSQQHFLQLLRENNLNHYERNGIPTGIVHDDLKFRFSRLDVPFKEIPVDPKMEIEEQKVLDEIQVIRATRSIADKDLNSINFNK